MIHPAFLTFIPQSLSEMKYDAQKGLKILVSICPLWLISFTSWFTLATPELSSNYSYYSFFGNNILSEIYLSFIFVSKI